MCGDNPEAVEYFFFPFRKPSVSLRVDYSPGKQLKGYLLCQFSHKSLLGTKRHPWLRGENVAISGAALTFCQRHAEDPSSSGHPRQGRIKAAARRSPEYSVMSFDCDRFKCTRTVGKSGGPDRDCCVFHEFGGSCNVYLPGRDHRSSTHSPNTGLCRRGWGFSPDLLSGNRFLCEMCNQT